MKLRFFPFELSIAWKYLMPKKRSLSSSLISLLSVFVITLVVWLIVVFLSVTTGIEKNWLTKLTALQAPIRIYPTKAYFQSYFYQIDNFASASGFALKSIGEKASSKLFDPYNPESDIELPPSFPAPTELDPVKGLFSILQEIKENDSSLAFQEYETTAALMRIRIDSNTVLSQVNYLASFPSKNPNLTSLLIPPSSEDLQIINQEVYPLIDLVSVETIPYLSLPPSFFNQKGKVKAYYQKVGEKVHSILLSQEQLDLPSTTLSWNKNKKILHLDKEITADKIPTILCDPMPVKVNDREEQYPYLSKVSFAFGNQHFEGTLTANDIQIKEGTAQRIFSSPPETKPFWPHIVDGKGRLPIKQEAKAVVLPKSYKKQGVKLWSKGSLIYTSQKSVTGQEQQIPFFVAGFYDPGVLPVGGRFLFADKEIVRSISAQSPSISLDGTPTNGVFVWHPSIEDAPKIAKKIQESLSKRGMDPYWRVESFYDFSFSKEMLQQFQSDKTLFILLASIIIIVACSNIISFLILLVSDKKKEIAILRSMGATKKSIAIIFGMIGAIIGSFGSLLGTLAGIITLRKLHILTSFLEKIQGHTAFQPAFFGDTLPNSLSLDAVWFIFCITPLLSLIAGLIPAIKASTIQCSQTLREQG